MTTLRQPEVQWERLPDRGPSLISPTAGCMAKVTYPPHHIHRYDCSRRARWRTELHDHPLDVCTQHRKMVERWSRRTGGVLSSMLRLYWDWPPRNET